MMRNTMRWIGVLLFMIISVPGMAQPTAGTFNGVECSQRPYDHEIILNSEFMGERRSKIEKMEIVKFYPADFDGDWVRGRCDVRVTFKATSTPPEASIPKLQLGEVMTCARLLDAVKRSIAERKLDESILHGFWDHVFTTNFPEPSKQCFGVLFRPNRFAVGRYYFGWKTFEGQTYILWEND